MPKRAYALVSSSSLRSIAPQRRARVAIDIPALRGRIARARGTVSRGYTRRSGFYGRFGVGGELKFFDTTRALATPNAAGTIMNLSLNLIPQGVTESTRVGRKCTIRSLEMKGQIILPFTSTTSATSDRTRVIIYVDKQANGATAVAADIIEATVTVDRFRNLANLSRFTILLDRTYATRSSGGISATFGEHTLPWSYRNNSLNIPLEFDSTTGAITEVKSNNIGVLAISGTTVASFGYEARVRYSDV